MTDYVRSQHVSVQFADGRHQVTNTRHVHPVASKATSCHTPLQPGDCVLVAMGTSTEGTQAHYVPGIVGSVEPRGDAPRNVARCRVNTFGRHGAVSRPGRLLIRIPHSCYAEACRAMVKVLGRRTQEGTLDGRKRSRSWHGNRLLEHWKHVGDERRREMGTVWRFRPPSHGGLSSEQVKEAFKTSDEGNEEECVEGSKVKHSLGVHQNAKQSNMVQDLSGNKLEGIDEQQKPHDRLWKKPFEELTELKDQSEGPQEEHDGPQEEQEGPQEEQEGPQEEQKGSQEVDEGSQEVEEGPQEVDEGSQEVDEGPQEVDEEPQEVDEEPQEVDEGPHEVDEGSQEVDEEPQEVDEGPQEVDEGPQEEQEGPHEVEGPQEVEEGPQEVDEGPQEVDEGPQENPLHERLQNTKLVGKTLDNKTIDEVWDGPSLLKAKSLLHSLQSEERGVSVSALEKQLGKGMQQVGTHLEQLEGQVSGLLSRQDKLDGVLAKLASRDEDIQATMAGWKDGKSHLMGCILLSTDGVNPVLQCIVVQSSLLNGPGASVSVQCSKWLELFPPYWGGQWSKLHARHM